MKWHIFCGSCIPKIIKICWVLTMLFRKREGLFNAQCVTTCVYLHSTDLVFFCYLEMAYYCYWSAGLKGVVSFPSGVWWRMKKVWDQATGCGQYFLFPSVPWHWWLGGRKDIHAIENPVAVICRGCLPYCWMRRTRGKPADLYSPGNNSQ